jgi:hypothetical protein
VEATWEPEKNITASELVRKFWENVGLDRDQFTDNGRRVEASSQFICKSVVKNIKFAKFVIYSGLQRLLPS